MTLTNQIIPGVGMGKIPFWLRQQGLVSRSAETIRPGGFILTQRALDICGFNAEDPVLDAGCGVGMTLGYLHDTGGIRALGLDRDPDLLGRAAGDKNEKKAPPGIYHDHRQKGLNGKGQPMEYRHTGGIAPPGPGSPPALIALFLNQNSRLVPSRFFLA